MKTLVLASLVLLALGCKHKMSETHDVTGDRLVLPGGTVRLLAVPGLVLNNVTSWDANGKQYPYPLITTKEDATPYVVLRGEGGFEKTGGSGFTGVGVTPDYRRGARPIPQETSLANVDRKQT